jgi:hypothetical protein
VSARKLGQAKKCIEELNVRQSEIAEWVLRTVAAGGGFKGFEIHLCCQSVALSSPKEQHRDCGRVNSGVRRALSFFDVQVDSWWDLDEAAAS